MVVVATMAVMPIGTTAFATDNAFADGKKHYEKNQAVSQANDCGNGELPLISDVKIPPLRFRVTRM